MVKARSIPYLAKNERDMGHPASADSFELSIEISDYFEARWEDLFLSRPTTTLYYAPTGQPQFDSQRPTY